MKAVRCAIYTRKSSEEGLEQDFNSLDAQRAACRAYILSQASEGWHELSRTYDDGGISGGTLERPGLKQLLADVAAGEIDIIVVYKVDRLTRALLDFAKLVEAFDSAGVSFVSVTQSFNTTTSMGRLTLNMLLSFAQFEREVTAERIRDKIAASKARGMWMGGTPPLGYRPDGRSLAIVPEHAPFITDIFQRYLALGNVRLVVEALAHERIAVPLRTTTTGKSMGGGWFTRGQIYQILRCPTYIGEIRHHDSSYPGLHQPIIDRETWDAVQAKLADNRHGERIGRRASNSSLLVGLVKDEDGNPLLADHATKGKVRYRYYAAKEGGIRIPARELEGAVVDCLARALLDPVDLAFRLGIPPGRTGEAKDTLQAAATQVTARDRAFIYGLVEGVEVGRNQISIRCNGAAIAAALGYGDAGQVTETLLLTSAITLTRSGRSMRLVYDNGAGAAPAANPR